MSLLSRAEGCRYFHRVHVRSESGEQSGYLRGCCAYFDNAHLTVLLRYHRNLRLRRPFPLVTIDPPTVGVDDPQDYEGSMPIQVFPRTSVGYEQPGPKDPTKTVRVLGEKRVNVLELNLALDGLRP